MLVRNFKTGSFISGLAATTLNPDIAYGASRLRQITNPAWNFVVSPTQAQGSTSGYTSGGINPPNTTLNTIDKFPFASDANATDVGDLSYRRIAAAGQSSTTDGYTSGGYGSVPGTPPGAFTNIIDKFPFATNANATDVGDLTAARWRVAGQSSTASGYSSGGGNGPTNVIDKFPFASNANASDVGDITVARGGVGQSSTTDGYTSGGYKTPPAPTATNIIDKFPFATNANATDVGDITVGRYDSSGQNSNVSGYTSGGQGPGLGFSNVIDKFPFATNANATDVGDLTGGRYAITGQNSTVSGYSSGGNTNVPVAGAINVIDKFPFASDANATDVGDLTQARFRPAGQQV